MRFFRSVAGTLGLLVLPGSAQGSGRCPPLGTLGGQVCVCAAAGAERPLLLIDGRPTGPAVAREGEAWLFELPRDLAPGPHRLALGGPGTREAAGGESSACTLTAVRVDAEIDRDKLRRLQSTRLRLTLAGTREKIAVRLVNHTPAIVDLEGGADQVVTSSGGRLNRFERSVRGLSPGDFHISFDLVSAACPCATGGTPGEQQAGPSLEHPPIESPSETPTVYSRPPSERPPDRAGPQPPEPIRPPTELKGPITGPDPSQPPVEEPCASIGEEIEIAAERYESIQTEYSRAAKDPSKVTTQGKRKYPYCFGTYTRWQYGAQAVGTFRLLADIRSLADFCLGLGTCQPERHRQYVQEIDRIALAMSRDPLIGELVRGLPELATGLDGEYQADLAEARARLREIEGQALRAPNDDLRFAAREEKQRIASLERLAASVRRWGDWAREVTASFAASASKKP